jgi:hypothetical protein
MNIWSHEMSEMTLPQIKDELSTCIKSEAYIVQLLELAEAGDVVDEHVVDILNHKRLYWGLRKSAFAIEEREQTKAANAPSAVAAH